LEKTFAVINDGLIENAIIAESLIIAEALLPDFEIIEVTEDSGPCFIGGTYEGGIFWPPQPYPSWVKNYELKFWESPIPVPEVDLGFFHEWNEEDLKWEILEVKGIKEEL
jgi:hypothetical protein